MIFISERSRDEEKERHDNGMEKSRQTFVLSFNKTGFETICERPYDYFREKVILVTYQLGGDELISER